MILWQVINAEAENNVEAVNAFLISTIAFDQAILAANQKTVVNIVKIKSFKYYKGFNLSFEVSIGSGTYSNWKKN